eukprot:m.109026 g.109026  ORF g.109026 m.109026 type:complete len:520 (-) comp15879_c0_seq1:485-2044(-)
MAEPEWVEILEPESRQKMYANIVTGDCRWSPPEGVDVKPCHANQWWELKDAKTDRYYYYNVASQTTMWEKPAVGDIIALERLQQMQDQMQQEEDRTTERVDPSSTLHAPATGGAIPTAPKMSPKPKIYSNDDLMDYKANLSTHKRGLIIKKKVSIATMLSWSKELIKSPMLLTHNKKDRKDAIELFKSVQMYMGDRKSQGKDQLQIVVEIVDHCWSTTSLRDEIYIQLCKQTYGNRSPSSNELGWELMLICLSFFPPSTKFFSYLQGYINRNTLNAPVGEVASLAEKALRKLERIEQLGAKRGTKQPTAEEVEHARKLITHPSVFGSTLEDVMEAQADVHPDLKVPYVLKVLTEAIIKRNGHRTEGIFRVPGDIDAVNNLKVLIDKNERPEESTDPHVPGSALKLWFRELYEPLIPADTYNACIKACDDAVKSVEVVSTLPELNRRILLYIIRFLQLVGHPDNMKANKMTYDNLAMVWSPNFLRCPSNDPRVIFDNTKKEMTFVRHLILNLVTDEVADV